MTSASDGKDDVDLQGISNHGDALDVRFEVFHKGVKDRLLNENATCGSTDLALVRHDAWSRISQGQIGRPNLESIWQRESRREK